jgi:hypothetical protein
MALSARRLSVASAFIAEIDAATADEAGSG